VRGPRVVIEPARPRQKRAERLPALNRSVRVLQAALPGETRTHWARYNFTNSPAGVRRSCHRAGARRAGWRGWSGLFHAGPNPPPHQKTPPPPPQKTHFSINPIQSIFVRARVGCLHGALAPVGLEMSPLLYPTKATQRGPRGLPLTTISPPTHWRIRMLPRAALFPCGETNTKGPSPVAEQSRVSDGRTQGGSAYETRAFFFFFLRRFVGELNGGPPCGGCRRATWVNGRLSSIDKGNRPVSSG